MRGKESIRFEYLMATTAAEVSVYAPKCYGILPDSSGIAFELLKGFRVLNGFEDIVPAVEAINGLSKDLKEARHAMPRRLLRLQSKKQAAYYNEALLLLDNIMREGSACLNRNKYHTIIDELSDEAAICHGDCGHSNLLLKQQPNAKPTAILVDFEFSHFGPPGFDAARLCASCLDRCATNANVRTAVTDAFVDSLEREGVGREAFLALVGFHIYARLGLNLTKAHKNDLYITWAGDMLEGANYA